MLGAPGQVMRVMNEAEITSQIVQMMDLTLAGVSVFFSIVSAYIVALYYFLRHAPQGLKLTAFIFFTLTFVFLGVFAANCFSHAASLQAALIELGEVTELSAVGRKAVESGLVGRGVLDQSIRIISWAGMALIYGALTYFTFIHSWREDGQAESA